MVPLGWEAAVDAVQATTSQLLLGVRIQGAFFAWAEHLPGSDWKVPFVGALAYLLCAYLANRTLEWRKSHAMFVTIASSGVLRSIALAHNAAMIVFSAAISVLTAYDLVVYIRARGLYDFACPPVGSASADPPLMSGRLIYWTYLFYISKFYELTDSVLLALKNKRLIGLHIWHHMSMLPAVCVPPSLAFPPGY